MKSLAINIYSRVLIEINFMSLLLGMYLLPDRDYSW